MNKQNYIEQKLSSTFGDNSQSVDNFINRKEYSILISQTGFKNFLYDNEWQIAVHVALSTFKLTSFNKNDDFLTTAITVENIFEALNLDKNMRNKKRQLDKIKDTLNELRDNGVIKINEIDNERFMIMQTSTTFDSDDNAYFTISYTDYLRITSIKKTSEKIYALATYASIVTRINRIDKVNFKKYVEGPRSFDGMNICYTALSFETMENIARKINVSKNTVNKSIKKLVEIKVIFAVKVKNKNHKSGQSKHYYSKYSERVVLQKYFEAMSLSNSDNANEQLVDIDLAYRKSADNSKAVEEEDGGDVEEEIITESVEDIKEDNTETEEVSETVTETETEEDNSQSDNANNLAKEFNLTDEELRQYQEFADELDCSVKELLADEVSRKQRELEQDNFENVEDYQEPVTEADVIDFERVTDETDDETDEESEEELEVVTEAVREAEKVSESDEEDTDKINGMLAMLEPKNKTEQKKIKIAKHSMKHVLKNDLTAIFNGGTSSRYEEMTEKD